MFVSTPTYSKNYILNIAQISEYELPVAGEKSLNLSNLNKVGLPVQAGFIITSKTFDDFIFSNNLITKINEINAQVYQGRISTKKAEASIKRLIQNGKFPNLMQESLSRAYALLTNGKDMTLKLEISSVNAELKESIQNNNENIILCDNFQDFLQKLKTTWTELFSREAIDFRLNTKYKGVLSMAVVVSKFLVPEITGRSYSLAVDNANPELIEIRAVYGISPDSFLNQKFPDRYLIISNSEQIAHRNLKKQNWMYIRNKGRITKIPIDEQRQLSAKLSDIQILRLARIVNKLKDHFKNELKIDWYYSGGKIFFTDMTRLREVDVIKARKLLAEDISTNSTVNTAPIIPEKFNLQPLDKLTKLTKGVGNKLGLVYGRVKLVRNAQDLENAKAINILVIDKFPKKLNIENKHYRGIITEEIIKKDFGSTPFISSAKDVSSLILDNEVVTIDTDSGIVYLGAGFKPVVQQENTVLTESIRPNTINTKEINVTMHRPVTQGLFKTNLIEKNESQNWIPEEKVKTESVIQEVETREVKDVAVNMTDEWYLKPPVFVDDEITESGCEFLQILNVENPRILNNTNGIYFQLSSVLHSLDIDKYEMVRNNHLKRKFIDFIEAYLIQFIDVNTIYIMLDVVETSKDLLANSEVLDFSFDLVKRLKYKTNLKNISIMFPDVRTEHELSLLKKQAVSSGIRRSSTFKMQVEVASPLAGISVNKIADEGIDAIKIDLEKLNKNLGCEETSKLSNEVIDFVIEIIKKVKKTTVPSYLCINKQSLNDDNLAKLINAGVGRFIFPESKIIELSAIIENLEIKNLKPSKPQRGRRKKDINYGF